MNWALFWAFSLSPIIMTLPVARLSSHFSIDRLKMAARNKKVAALPRLMQALRKEAAPLPQKYHAPLPSLRRAFSIYDQINLIDNIPQDQLRFQEIYDSGFKINGLNYEGSLICMGNFVMSWTPNKFSDITAQSLSIFQTVQPIPDILILGCGRHIQSVDPKVRSFIRSTGIKLEAIDSRNAASTYNILNEEGRIVAAALLPYGVSS